LTVLVREARDQRTGTVKHVEKGRVVVATGIFGI